LAVSCPQEDSSPKGFDAEYDLSMPGGCTTCGLHVVYPSWLAVEDRQQVLDLVDAYVTLMGEEYDLEWMPWSKYTLFLHSAIDKCVDRPRWTGVVDVTYRPEWMHGFVFDTVAVATWSPERDQQGNTTGIRWRDALGVLPHELFHLVFWEQYGAHGRDQIEYYALDSVRSAVRHARDNAPLLAFSQQTLENLSHYVYTPWAWPS